MGAANQLTRPPRTERHARRPTVICIPDDRSLAASARPRPAHRRRRVRLRRHDGAPRRGRLRGALRRVLDRDPLAASRLSARHARPRGARGDGRARDPRVAADGARLRRAHVPGAPPGHPRAARRALGGVAARTSSSSPSHHDVHQDHQTIAQEGLRAFKRTTILGYEIPWNNFDFSYGAYVALEQRHLERKIAAVEQLRLAAAPPLRERRVHPEPRQGARHEREPRARRGVPGLPHRRE